MLIYLKNQEKGRVFRKICNNFPPNILSYFEPCQHMYLKRTNFRSKIDNWKRYTWCFNENFEKIWIFFLTLFHMGVLCSKNLNGLGRFEKWMKKFNFQFSVLLLTQRMRKSCTQSEIFSLGGKCFFGTVYWSSSQ